MSIISKNAGRAALLALLAMPVAGVAAQEQESTDPNIVVTGTLPPDVEALPKGPEIEGIISARKDDRIQIALADGSSTSVALLESTKIRTSSGLFGGRSKLGTAALLNGLPVTVKTVQWNDGLLASQISFRKGDLKTARMIHSGTDQRFAEQTAATEQLRGRVSDIDKYNIKGTTNVYFDTGKWVLTPQAKQELCATASQAEATDNALLLVVGYTDSVGSEEYNQTLSEKRASSVINYLQQHCRWAPYRVLTPTGMSESNPVADNDTKDGKAQNRRVAVNILVSKSVDGL